MTLPSGTVTFAFTDIEGSTKRWEDNRAEMENAVRRHDHLMQEAITANGGHVFKTVGDAFCAAFSRPEYALAAMLDAQRALAAEDFSAIDGLRVSAALHTGTCDEREGDYFGPTVNRVARLLAIGHGGQVLVSGATCNLLRAVLPADVRLRDLGEHRLRDLFLAERVYQIVASDLSDEFPPLRSLDELANNLPLQLKSFVGREAEIAEISAMVDKYRLVTLVGSGGVGKTRTSLQVAANLLDGSGDGVWFIELAPLTVGDNIPAAAAQALGITLATAGDPIDSLTRALKSKRALLVFDNCEHLVESASHVIGAILRGCPKVKVLSTSRQFLGLDGEATYRMPSLSLPSDPNVSSLTADASARYSALLLFVERARAVDNGFGLSDENAPIIAEICRRLDGIPLAIELAASRVKMLSVSELRDRLHERFRVLTGGGRDVLPRQQTLRATIDWSYNLLAPAERKLFTRVGIFVDGFTLEAASTICVDEAADDFDVLESLSSLVEKSLVIAEREGSLSRYRLLETTRAYALENLARDDDPVHRARRHAEYFCSLAKRNDTTWGSVQTKVMVAQLTPELGNLRSALTWAIDARSDPGLGAQLVSALRPFFAVRSLNAEGVRWCDAALAGLGDHPEKEPEAALKLTSAAMIGAAPFYPRFYFYRSKFAEEFFAAAQRAAELFRILGDDRSLVLSLSMAAMHLTLMDRLEAALTTADEALDVARRCGDRLAVSRSLYAKSFAVRPEAISERKALLIEAYEMCRNAPVIYDRAAVLQALGELTFMSGDADKALRYALEGQATYEGLNAPGYNAQAQVNVAAYSLVLGRLDDALKAAADALSAAQRTSDSMIAAASLLHLATIAATKGDVEQGARFLGASDARRSGAPPRLFTEQSGYDRTIAMLREALMGARLDALMREGSAWTLDHAGGQAKLLF